MKRLDLIIDALELACHETYGLAASDCYSQALAAARELRELEPVAWKYEEYRSAFMTYLWFDEVQFVQPPNEPERFKNITPLYDLGDEK